jgi:hypothetical protein
VAKKWRIAPKHVKNARRRARAWSENRRRLHVTDLCCLKM